MCNKAAHMLVGISTLFQTIVIKVEHFIVQTLMWFDRFEQIFIRLALEKQPNNWNAKVAFNPFHHSHPHARIPAVANAQVFLIVRECPYTEKGD